ncbi:hypothetical protein U8C32_08495 [Sinorhizobium medicae]|uniref:hypothetical protein n=1 Tax=Sinorhizobium medicae TaxID=110321 RepID=UPI002AF6B616|nr:hypothetical protein [Sinorhizobium medicae]WQO46962.1 hypothetical protein U8C42_08540 [Sinorhizobium medicae]WQO63905.1 hypothetical protein U8C40_11950 [Sinorhizobium medicae]WQO74324.1 hypothetical protein U8C31_08700 [Sinorhizobium medicae]WQO93592.1 hypothetical protein U8C32_08495 [Sinorhizobium medicae]
MADRFNEGEIVVCIDASGKHSLTEGKEYRVICVSTSGGSIQLRNDQGRRVGALARRFKKVEQKSQRQAKYEMKLALYAASGGLFPYPEAPKKVPRSIKIDPRDAKAALTKMLKEVYGIDATVEQVIGAMDKSLELVLGA